MSDFYTVSEFAVLTGKDPGNIRRRLIKGEIKGEKIGKQWIIPKSTAYPEDRRIKSGIYRNWRKRPEIRNAHPELICALQKMCIEIYHTYGSYLDKIVLYGSYARGEETDESDVDIAVILKDGNTEAMHEQMLDIVVDYEIEQGVTLSVVPIEYEKYVQWNKVLPFFVNIDKEGIVLWKAA